MTILRHGFMALALLWLAGHSVPVATGPAYPVKASANGRYLVDQNNAPYLMMGDSPQALIVNLTDDEAEAFLADRGAHGFNTVWINLLCATYTGGRTDASTLDGTLPFTSLLPGSTSYDLSKPNEAYFAHVDHVLQLAAQHGLQVLLDPIETGSFTSVLLDNGPDAARAYGQFLGRRYRGFDNIIWMSGNDFQDWRNPTSDAVVRATALGIKETDERHLQTSELDYVVSSSLDDDTWTPILTLNATYTYYPTYAQLLKDYDRAHFLPNFMVEANYEFEHDWTGNATLRRQEYWSMLSGAAGQLYGNGFTWPFASEWQDHLDTPGVTQFEMVKALFAPRAWYDLIPDQKHSVVTAGYGTFIDKGSVNDSDYVTAAHTLDGALVMAYMPTARTLTVDMSALSGPAVGHWFDPASGEYAAITGSPFANAGSRDFAPPGQNSDGDTDWVLVLETHPPNIPIPPVQPRFVQQSYVTPQSPTAEVTVAYEKPQIAGHTNIVAIGWNDEAASIVSVRDTAGNVYQVAVATYRGQGMSQALYYASAITAGNNTVTVTFDQPAKYVDLRATEYSGLRPGDAYEAGSSGAGDGTAADSGPVTTTGANTLLFGAGMTATTFSAPGNGFAQRAITAPDGDIVEDRLVADPGAYPATASLTTGAWLMQVAAFRPADVPPPSPTTPATPAATEIATATATVMATATSTATPGPSPTPRALYLPACNVP